MHLHSAPQGLTRRWVAAVLAILTIGAGLAMVTATPARADHGDYEVANAAPFVGTFTLWCTQRNPSPGICNSHHNRPAMDIGMPNGTPIYAAGEGEIEAATSSGDGRGTYIEIRHPDGIESRYYHLSTLQVSVGQQVTRGEQIALSGSTGSTTAPHLHYEERAANGAEKDIGVMYGISNGQQIQWPHDLGHEAWSTVPFGTTLVNEAFACSPFSDVACDAWFLDAALWAAGAGVMTGFPDGTFRGGDTMTRAQSVNAVWVAAGSPAAEGPHGFTDVAGGAWYGAALDWADEVGLVDSGLDPLFAPNAAATRDVLAGFLWTAAGRPVADPAGFTDTAGANEAAIDWVAERGYASGFGDNTFRPDEDVLRSQAVSWMWAMRQFSDVGAGVWYEPGSDWARFRGVVSGFPDHTFRGSVTVNRAQAVNMVWRTNDDPVAATGHPFTDVAAGVWYESALDWAAEAVIVTGWPDGTFRPKADVNRAQAVMMLWRLAGEPAATTSHPFSDVDAGIWFEAGLDWAAEHGIVTGYQDGTFRASDPVSRAQIVVQLRRLAATAAAWSPSVTPPSTVLF